MRVFGNVMNRIAENHTAAVVTVGMGAGRWRPEGESLKSGTVFSLGQRSTYHDYSF